jgi:hypothetical protein
MTLWDQLWALVRSTEEERKRSMPRLSGDMWVRGAWFHVEQENLRELVRLLTIQVEAQQREIDQLRNTLS